MGNGGDFLARMHPADLEEIKEALRGPPRSLEQPFTGVDASVFQRIIREEIAANRINKSGPDEQALRRIVREEIARDRKDNLENCQRMIHEEAERILDERLPKVFRDLDMSIDPDDIKETRKKLGRLFDWQENAHAWKGNFVSTLVKALGLWAAGLVTAGIGFLGWKGGH